MFVRSRFAFAAIAVAVAGSAADVCAEPRTAAELSTPANLNQAAVPQAPQPAVAAKPPRPAVTLVAKADLARQTLTVVENGRQLYVWKISSGVQDHATPVGTFQPEWTAKMWYSRKYDDAPMPHSVFFKNGAAIHATQSVGRLGQAASHGCVRLAPTNAEIFYKLVLRHGLPHTRISVFGTPNYPHQQIASRTTRHNVANTWDNQPSRPIHASRSGPFASSPFTSNMYAYNRLSIATVRSR